MESQLEAAEHRAHAVQDSKCSFAPGLGPGQPWLPLPCLGEVAAASSGPAQVCLVNNGRKKTMKVSWAGRGHP